MDEITRALLPVVADPEQVALLYAHLREFCHDIRCDLSLYRMQIYLARLDANPGQDDALVEVEGRYDLLERFVLQLHTICRPMEPLRMCVSLDLIVDERNRSWAEQFARHGRTLRLGPPRREVAGHLDPTLLGNALDALATWRAELGPGAGEANVRWDVDGRQLRLRWDEPKPACAVAAGRLPSLALVFLGRVLAVHGGSLAVDDREGFHLEARLPLDEPAPLAAVSRPTSRVDPAADHSMPSARRTSHAANRTASRSSIDGPARAPA